MVQWGEYRIADLFEKIKTNNVIKNKNGDLPATTAVWSNNQIGKYISRENATILKNVFTATANGFGKVFYQPYEFTVLQDSYAFKFKDSSVAIDKVHSFIISLLNKVFSKYQWNNKSGWNKVKEETIQLPTKNNQIDFEFMESFISELEEERISELDAYLTVSNLNNYELTNKELEVLNRFNNQQIEWGEYRIGDLFEVNSSKKIFHANYINIWDNKEDNNFPYVVRKTLDNGIRGYIKEDQKYLNPGNTLSFAQDTFIVFYQKSAYFTGNKVKVLNPKFAIFNEKIGEFIVSMLQNELCNLSWGNGSDVNMIKSFTILLPTTNNQIDFEFMETFIKAIQKLVIKEVVNFKDKKIQATKEVTRNK
ncbi:restriction endonuclease subunit S [Mycoplasmopsis opalescens]|uniref:restriction endonuclease subunit S n=1 Tax=Mycoplasmopsis opalescens TaxID=114886 RepID=UPI0004A723BB|nr:restriction endonuclease subunit S [Mycoplasmopsis opalescens]